MIRRPPNSPLFPYTPLFRSDVFCHGEILDQPSHAAGDDLVLFPVLAEDVVEDADRADRSRRHRLHRSEEHTSELQSPDHLVCRLLLEKKKIMNISKHSNAQY